METHGPLVTTIVLWLTMLSPLICLVAAFLGAWFFGQLNG
jgi:hypothetical protein